MTSTTTRLVVGCMSGTSMDGIDAALMEITGRGLDMSAKLVAGASGPLGPGAATLRRLADGQPCTAKDITEAARSLALAHVDVIRQVIAQSHPSLICVHGQTVFHAPPLSWQLINPAPIASAIGAPVVHDLRAMDLARGGQGAPITPIADRVLFRVRSGDVACVINLGGFANATIWREGDAIDQMRGFDICACNQVLDALARERLNAPFDADGAHAVTGTVNPGARERIHTTLLRQWRVGRSLGTGDEAKDAVLRITAQLPPADACATAVDAMAEVIATAVDEAAKHTNGPRRILLAGGGSRNTALTTALSMYLCVRDPRSTVTTTADRGIPIEMREAACFAVLGALCQDRVPITLPQVTAGPRDLISGCWTGL